MKKVIFVCLLSLSVCLGKPTNEPGPGSQTSSTTTAATAHTNPSNPTTVPPHAIVTTPATQDPAKTSTEKAGPVTTPKQNNTVVPIPGQQGGNASNSAITNNGTAITTVTPPHSTEKAGTTTKKPEAPTQPTTIPPHKSDVKPPQQARGFDGASFIGGIILTLGLLAIGFMGFKYYKNQTERNYHTL